MEGEPDGRAGLALNTKGRCKALGIETSSFRQMSNEITWSPSWAPHVVGTVQRKSDDMDPEEPQIVWMTCSACGQRWKAFCYSGHYERRIGRFSILHLQCLSVDSAV